MFKLSSILLRIQYTTNYKLKKSYRNKTTVSGKREIAAECLMELDDNVGKIMKKLEQKNASKNTVLLFLSGNKCKR